MSTMATFLSLICKTKLLKWSEHYDILTDPQFDFRTGLAILALHTIIDKSVSLHTRLYSCLADYKGLTFFVDRRYG